MGHRGPALLVAALLAPGCGRLAFDHRPDGGTNEVDAPAAAPFDPDASGCRAAENGPFALAGTVASLGSGYGVVAVPPFVVRADTTGGLHSFTFDGSTFEQVDGLTDLGWVEAVWNGAGVLFVGAPGTGLTVVELSAAGELAVLAQDTTTVAQARRGWYSDGIVYVPAGGDGLHALAWNGSQLAPLGTPAASTGWSQGLYALGTRVLLADNSAFRVFDFDGAAFTESMPADTSHGGETRVWSNGTTAFVANGDGVTAYSVGATSLVELDTFATADGARDVWFDGQHVFVAAQTAGVYALRFDGAQLTLADQIDTGGAAVGVAGDGSYIYTNDAIGGLRAHRGFACTEW